MPADEEEYVDSETEDSAEEGEADDEQETNDELDS